MCCDGMSCPWSHSCACCASQLLLLLQAAVVAAARQLHGLGLSGCSCSIAHRHRRRTWLCQPPYDQWVHMVLEQKWHTHRHLYVYPQQTQDVERVCALTHDLYIHKYNYMQVYECMLRYMQKHLHLHAHRHLYVFPQCVHDVKCVPPCQGFVKGRGMQGGSGPYSELISMECGICDRVRTCAGQDAQTM
jgi:hypothetical protein